MQHPPLFGHKPLILSLTLTLAAIMTPSASAATSSRFAYATIHYEGTPNDSHYVLGIRVLLKSLSPLQHPFVVLASRKSTPFPSSFSSSFRPPASVSQETRSLLISEGATIVPINNVENPFQHGLKRFVHTFNKVKLSGPPLAPSYTSK